MTGGDRGPGRPGSEEGERGRKSQWTVASGHRWTERPECPGRQVHGTGEESAFRAHEMVQQVKVLATQPDIL